jgi:hypothetical protein
MKNYYKLVIVCFVIITIFAFHSLVFAQASNVNNNFSNINTVQTQNSKCTVNGKAAPCNRVLFLVLLFAIIVLGIVFWLFMSTHSVLPFGITKKELMVIFGLCLFFLLVVFVVIFVGSNS